MEVDLSPASLLALPDARLKGGGSGRGAVRADTLVEADIGDHGHIIIEDTHTRRAHGRVVRPLGAAELEVEAVELQALNQLTARLRLEGSQRRVGQVLIGGPVGAG